MRHFLNPLDFSTEELDQILGLAERIRENPDRFSHVAEGKKLATLFYEPSTRTRLSFEAAMLNLGGKTLDVYKRQYLDPEAGEISLK